MPRRLIAQINASLDGYIEDEKHDIDWHFVDDEYEEFINETLRSLDGMISAARRTNLSRRTGPPQRPIPTHRSATFRSGADVLTYQPASANQGNDPEGTEHEQ